MATKTVAEKLRIKPNTSVWSSQPEYLALIGALPEGVKLADSMAEATTAVVFVASEAIARELLEHLQAHLAAPDPSERVVDSGQRHLNVLCRWNGERARDRVRAARAPGRPRDRGS